MLKVKLLLGKIKIKIKAKDKRRSNADKKQN
jgi:hypothetical protein